MRKAITPIRHVATPHDSDPEIAIYAASRELVYSTDFQTTAAPLWNRTYDTQTDIIHETELKKRQFPIHNTLRCARNRHDLDARTSVQTQSASSESGQVPRRHHDTPTTTPNVETEPAVRNRHSQRPGERPSLHLVRQIAPHHKSMRSWPNGHAGCRSSDASRFESRRGRPFSPRTHSAATDIDQNRGKNAFLHAHTPYLLQTSNVHDRAKTQIIHIMPAERPRANANAQTHALPPSNPQFPTGQLACRTINHAISPPDQAIPPGYVHTRRNLPYLIPNCEAKSSWAGLVLAWGTSWEPHGDVTFFYLHSTIVDSVSVMATRFLPDPWIQIHRHHKRQRFPPRID